ncbi:MAG: hypothetical protein ABFR62_10425 [Bacteroidota bacterium]
MDKAMKILATIIPMIVVIGSILEYFQIEKANILTGIGVLAIMFILIPFFLFWRYDKKQKRKLLDSEKKD